LDWIEWLGGRPLSIKSSRRHQELFDVMLRPTSRMTCHRRRSRALITAVVICAVGSWPAYVDAHAVFVNAPATIPADSDVVLTMNVPHERDDTTYNVDVAMQLPEGWTGVACQTKATWTCTMPTESGHVVIRFVKDAGAPPAEDEAFQFTAHAGPAQGTVSIPTLQTYNTGEVVAWIGDPNASEPAPTLQVGPAAPTTPPVTPAPTNPADTAPPATPAPTAAPTTAIPTSTVPSTSTTSPTSTTTTTSAPSTTSTTATTSTSSTVALTTTTEPSDADSDDSNTGVIVAIVVLLAAAGAGTYVFVRRRRPTIPPVD
jgi:uncharacterized protein YcnI